MTFPALGRENVRRSMFGGNGGGKRVELGEHLTMRKIRFYALLCLEKFQKRMLVYFCLRSHEHWRFDDVIGCCTAFGETGEWPLLNYAYVLRIHMIICGRRRRYATGGENTFQKSWNTWRSRKRLVEDACIAHAMCGRIKLFCARRAKCWATIYLALKLVFRNNHTCGSWARCETVRLM